MSIRVTDEALALRAANLGVRYRAPKRTSLVALANVSVDVRRAEIVGVVGESGSGKSTLGKCLAGFLKPDSGTVTVHGGAGRRKIRVQMIFQESAMALDPRMPIWKSVAEALSTGRSIGKDLRPQVQESLSSVGLGPELMFRLPSEISGGQRQRVAIARAIASGANVIVCDEAVSALDASVRARVLELIVRLRHERSLAFVFISHDISVVAQISDRVVVMKKGEIVEQGATQEVIYHPRHPYTQALMAAVPRLQADQLRAG